MSQQSLGFFQRFYIVEVVQGLALTARHFFCNMPRHIARGVGLKVGKGGTVTIEYPEERRPYASRLRMMCETICPARCIHIVAAEHPDPNIEKMPKIFDIDIGVCVVCGFCVQACPEDAIRMDTGIVELAAYTREGMIYHMDQLLDKKPS